MEVKQPQQQQQQQQLESQQQQEQLKQSKTSIDESSSLHLLNQLLDQNTSKYHILYRKFRANHLSHGLIALYELGATPARLQLYYDNYTRHVELVPAKPLDHSIPPISRSNWKKYLGDSDHFTNLKEFFRGEMDRCGNELMKASSDTSSSQFTRLKCKKLVNEYFPILAEGLLGDAFHGMIQLGYGLEVMNETTVIEGLAFLASVFQPTGKYQVMKSSITKQNTNLLEELNTKVRLNDTVQYIINHEFNQEMNFLDKLTVLLSDKYLNSIREQFDWSSIINTSSSTGIQQMLDSIWKWILRVYACSEGNFFVLHCVTATRSFQQIFALLDSVDAKKECIGYLWRSFILCYIAVGAPELTNYHKYEQESEKLKLEWNEIIQMALKAPKDGQENTHDIKIVFSCWKNESDVGHDSLHKYIARKQITREASSA